MIKRFACAVLACVMALSIITMQTTLAWSGALPAAAPHGLTALAWPHFLQVNDTCTGSCVTVPSFDPSTFSYVIGTDPSNLDSYSCSFPGITTCYGHVLYIAPAGHKLQLIGDGGGTYHLQVDSGSYYRLSMTEYGGSKHWGSSLVTYYTLGGFSNITGNTTDTTGVWVAKNVTYINWDQPYFSQNYQYGSNGSSTTASCKALDFGCWMGSIWNGVSDTLANVGQAIVQSIVTIFAPDGSQISDDFSAFNSFMQAKLGFLTYPVTFVVNVFNALSGTSNNWCTDSSCTIAFGNLFGKPFTVNLLQPAATMPMLWSWFKGLTVGFTIWELVLALRRKYIEVVKH